MANISKKTKNLRIGLIAIVVLSLFILASTIILFAPPTFAESARSHKHARTTEPTDTSDSSTTTSPVIAISPVSAEFPDLTPGQVYEGSFRVINLGATDLTYSLGVTPYSSHTDDNSINTPDYTTRSRYTNLVDWIEFTSPETNTLAPKLDHTVNYKITVPEHASPGGQYAALTVEDASPKSSGSTGVTTVARVAFVIYGRVAGEVQESGSIASNNVPFFVDTPPVVATSLLKNSGNVHEYAEIELIAYDIFTGNEIYHSSSSQADTNKHTATKAVVLPESSRYTTMTWQDSPRFGIFRLSQTIKYLGDTSRVEKIILICPIWLAILILAFVVALIVSLVAYVRSGRRST